MSLSKMAALIRKGLVVLPSQTLQNCQGVVCSCGRALVKQRLVLHWLN